MVGLMENPNLRRELSANGERLGPRSLLAGGGGGALPANAIARS